MVNITTKREEAVSIKPAPQAASTLATHMAKKNLNTVEATMPQKPITCKQKKSFKLDFRNDLRSMGVAYILDEDHEVPKQGDDDFIKYNYNKIFVYSCLMRATKGNEAREWLIANNIVNNGREGWKKILKQYDPMELEGTILSTAMQCLTNLCLSHATSGSASTYVTNFASALSELTIKGMPLNDALAQEMFINGIVHPGYFETKTDMKLNHSDLQTCMEKVNIIAGSIEREALKSNCCIAKVQSDSSSGSSSLQYKGKEVDKYGFFKNEDHLKNLSQKDKCNYFKVRMKWIKDVTCQRGNPSKHRQNQNKNLNQSSSNKTSSSSLESKETKFVRILISHLNVDEDGNFDLNTKSNQSGEDANSSKKTSNRIINILKS